MSLWSFFLPPGTGLGAEDVLTKCSPKRTYTLPELRDSGASCAPRVITYRLGSSDLGEPVAIPGAH